MASEAQILANRANAQKSTGPRTAEGKAAVSQNAVTHGLMARAAARQGQEQEEYAHFQEALLAELRPEGVQEREVAERIADLSWRLRRAGQHQNAVFEALYVRYATELAESGAGPETEGSALSDPVLGQMLLADFSGDRVLERAQLYERRIENSLHRARADLRQLRQGRESSCLGQSRAPGAPSGLSKTVAAAGPVRSGPVRASPEEFEKTNPNSAGVSTAPGQEAGLPAADFSPEAAAQPQLAQTKPVSRGDSSAPAAVRRVA